MTPENEPPLDVEKALFFFDNELDFFKSMCDRFLEYIPGQIEKLSSAAQAGKPEMVEIYAHGIKGAALTLSAGRTSSIARMIEETARDRNISDVDSLIADLRSAVAQLEEFIRRQP